MADDGDCSGSWRKMRMRKDCAIKWRTRIGGPCCDDVRRVPPSAFWLALSNEADGEESLWLVPSYQPAAQPETTNRPDARLSGA